MKIVLMSFICSISLLACGSDSDTSNSTTGNSSDAIPEIDKCDEVINELINRSFKPSIDGNYCTESKKELTAEDRPIDICVCIK